MGKLRVTLLRAVSSTCLTRSANSYFNVLYSVEQFLEIILVTCLQSFMTQGNLALLLITHLLYLLKSFRFLLQTLSRRPAASRSAACQSCSPPPPSGSRITALKSALHRLRWLRTSRRSSNTQECFPQVCSEYLLAIFYFHRFPSSLTRSFASGWVSIRAILAE